MTTKPYRTVWVRADMGEIKEKVKKKRQVGTRKIQKTKGLLKKETYEVEEPLCEEYEEWVPTGKRSDTYIDIDGFAQRIMEACNQLAEEGYEVIHISDVISGRYAYNTWEGKNRLGAATTAWGAGWGYGYGYSVTDGVVITARLQNTYLNP